MTDPSLPVLSGTDPVLDSYRRGVDAECDVLFSEAMRARQRSRVRRRLSEPRVLPFPVPGTPGRLGTAVSNAPSRPSRRWLGWTAAASLVAGLLAGSLRPAADPPEPVRTLSRSPQPVPDSTEPAPARSSPAGGTYVAAVALDQDDALLDAIEVAVSQRGPMELRALDDLTFQYDQR